MGLATQLIQLAEQIVKENGIEAILLGVRPQFGLRTDRERAR